MMRYEVYFRGENAGTAEAEEDGLYWRVQVRCRMRQGILRASAENVEKRVNLGVLAPEEGQLTLTRRVPRSSFCFWGDTALTLDETPRWERCEEAAGYILAGGRICREESGATVLVPYAKEKPFACMPLFCFFTLVTRQGRRYWQLLLNAQGEPVMPESA